MAAGDPVTGVANFFSGLFKFIPWVKKQFQKTPTEKAQKQEEKLDDRLRKEDETGRPQ